MRHKHNSHALLFDICIYTYILLYRNVLGITYILYSSVTCINTLYYLVFMPCTFLYSNINIYIYIPECDGMKIEYNGIPELLAGE